jgi:subtilisin family serine protease
MIAITVSFSIPGFAQREAPLHTQATRGGKAIPGSYIVVLQDGADAGAVTQRHGVAARYVYSSVINGFAGDLNRGQLNQLRRDPDVKYIDEDAELTLLQASPGSVAPPDVAGEIVADVVQPGATWGIDKLDQQWGAGTNGSYNYTNTGALVNVYIVDTGIRTTHTQFDGAALNRAKAGTAGFDVFGGNGQDCNGHGTHVAGTVGGTTWGVAKAAKLYSVRVLDCNGNGSFAGFIAGAEWVTANHIKPAVANASIGCIGGCIVQAAIDAVQKSVSWGVTWVVSAGNDNLNACNNTPAAAPSAITVGATDINNNKAGFSNHGACVDIHAPGVGITSAWWTSDVASAVLNGTSMASPHVAGLAALYHQTVKYAAPGQVTDAIKHAGVRGVVGGLPALTVNLLAHKVNGTHTGVNQAPGANCNNQEPDSFNGQCYYYSPAAGWHHVWLRGTVGAAGNFNLQLYRWNGAAWVLAVQKTGTSNNEYIKTFQPGATYYMALVQTAGGASGTYDLQVIHDGMRAQP